MGFNSITIFFYNRMAWEWNNGWYTIEQKKATETKEPRPSFEHR